MECILLELVSQRCAEAVGELLHQGFMGPIQTIAVGLNGSFIFGNYYEENLELEWEMKGHGLEPGEFQLPVNIFFVDRSGTSARVRLESSDQEVNVEILDDIAEGPGPHGRVQ